jgi:predicted enzyme related to lactoylglutathione lyase
MPRPVHFEIPAANPERAMQFYTNVFGWKFNKWNGPIDYWVISTGQPGEPGIDGGLMPRRDPNQPCVNTIGVAHLDQSLAAIEQNGGTCVVPKMPIPGVGWLAYCKDVDGHIFGIMQPDTSVKG